MKIGWKQVSTLVTVLLGKPSRVDAARRDASATYGRRACLGIGSLAR